MFRKILSISLIVAIIAALYFVYCGNTFSKNLKQQLDSLHHKNDSLYSAIHKQDEAIASLQHKADSLTDKVTHQKTRIVYIDHQVEVEKNKIDNLQEHQLVSLYNHRYPKDTITNPLPIAQPVLVSAAKDLVELDGAKEKLAIKDTIISLTEAKVVLKDSVIGRYINKETSYKSIIANKDVEIDLLLDENKKIKRRTRFHKVAITGLSAFSVYLLMFK